MLHLNWHLRNFFLDPAALIRFACAPLALTLSDVKLTFVTLGAMRIPQKTHSPFIKEDPRVL